VGLGIVVSAVFIIGHDLEIRGMVVLAIAVNVVDNLVGTQGPAQHLSGEKAVKGNNFVFGSHNASMTYFVAKVKYFCTPYFWAFPSGFPSGSAFALFDACSLAKHSSQIVGFSPAGRS